MNEIKTYDIAPWNPRSLKTQFFSIECHWSNVCNANLATLTFGPLSLRIELPLKVRYDLIERERILNWRKK